MKTLNEIRCTVPGISENESVVRGIVASFILSLDPTVAELGEVRTAVSEAVTNCIVHGYRNWSGNINITVKILENREIYIRIRDNGCGIENIEQAMEPFFTSAPDEERAGLGFAVMENFMDKIQVRSSGSGTVVIMRKKLS